MATQFFMVLNNIKAPYLFIVLSIILVRSCSGTNSSLSCRQEERDALFRFAKSLNPIFLNISELNQDCCKWSWITCDGVTGHVVKLETYPYNQTPVSTYPIEILPAIKLDASLAQLEFLNHLDLRGIALERCSRIPEFIASMKNLKFLDLSGVGFCGRVPHNFGNLTNLEFLSLGGSFGRLSLDGESRWISRLVILKHLDMSNVSVEEGGRNDLMTALSALPSLSYLDLRHCGLDDSVLNSTFCFSKLQYLDLSGNYLRGKFPSAIKNMASLTYLDLSNNQFKSYVPSWLGRFSNLRQLYLSRNKFDGCLASLPVNLKELDLSLSQLIGIIPSSFGNFSVLEMVNLSSNHLIGNIPRSFGRSLKKLDLRNNHLIGVIKIEQLSSLEYLDLSQNNLAAPIPSDIGRNMTQLRSLFL